MREKERKKREVKHKKFFCGFWSHVALNIGHVLDQFEQSGFFQSCPILFRPGINLKPFLTSMRKLQILDEKEEEEDNVSQPRGLD